MNAAGEVWLIGGGNHPDNSQAEIERNAIRTIEVLRELPGERRLHVLFTDGHGPLPDVKEWRRPADDPETLQPLARVYDTSYLNGESFRNHQVPGVEGVATRDEVRRLIDKRGRHLSAGDDLLLLYYGHGGLADGADRNWLQLWDDGQLEADTLAAWLDQAVPAARVRFVFTQCYSGGFQRLVYPAGAPDPERIDGQRCGFMAVPADMPAEGCSANLDEGNYRGYGMYLFEALGRAVAAGGPASPYAAHLQVLREARSTDLPRASSEQFLIDWQPWYLPVVPVPARSENPYRIIADALAADVAAGDRLDISRQQREIDTRIDRLMAEQDGSHERVANRRWVIRDALERRWPGVRHGHTAAFRDFLAHDLDAAQAFILKHPQYVPLRQEQDRYWVLDDAILALERRRATLDRVLLLRRLARTRDGLYHWGGKAEIAAYERLLTCEKAPL